MEGGAHCWPLLKHIFLTYVYVPPNAGNSNACASYIIVISHNNDNNNVNSLFIVNKCCYIVSV